MLHFSRVLATLANGEIVTILSQDVIGGKAGVRTAISLTEL